MQFIDWTTPGVKITDFALQPAQGERAFSAWAVGTYQGKECVLSFPVSFRNIPHDTLTETILLECHKAKRMDLAESLLIAGFGETIGRQALIYGQQHILNLTA